MVRRTREDALKNKGKILKVAKDLFCNAGYDRTNLCDIAKAAGVTRGAVYWHFSNKDALFMELWISLCNTSSYKKLVDKSKIINENNLENLKLWISGLVNVLNDKQFISMLRLVYGMIMGLQGTKRIRNQLMEFNSSLRAITHKFISNAVENGELSKEVNIEAASNYIHATLDGYIHQKIFHNNDDFVKYHSVIADTLIKNILIFKKECV